MSKIKESKNTFSDFDRQLIDLMSGDKEEKESPAKIILNFLSEVAFWFVTIFGVVAKSISDVFWNK